MRHILALLLMLSTPALASESAFPARVIDGDTIEIAGQSIRLVGIDAPEMSQPLGQASRDALRAIVDGRNVSCIWFEVDLYGRPLATCYPFLVTGKVSKVSINTRMVRAGWAAAGLPYGYSMERAQSRAMISCAGMWTELPWCYRRANQ